MSVALNRRRFLFGLCGLAAATPFAGMAIRRTRAAGGNTARRLIIFFSPNGTVHQHWRPQGGGNDFSFSAGSLLEPLTAIKDGIPSNTVEVNVSAAIITAIQVTPSPVNIAKGQTDQLTAIATFSDATSSDISS